MNQPHEHGRIVWLVRALTGVGLAVIAVTLALFSSTLSDVRTDRVAAAVEQAFLTQTADRIGGLTDDCRAGLASTFDERTLRPVGPCPAVGLTTLLTDSLHANINADVRLALTELQTAAANMAEQSTRASAWRTAYDVTHDDISNHRTMGRVQTMLAELRRRFDASDGRRRLRDAIAYRQWRHAEHTGDTAAAPIAARMLQEESRRQGRGFERFNDQLGEIARLVEMVGGEEKLDALADLRTNRLKPAMDRLAMAVAMDDSLRLDGDVTITPRNIADLATAVLGNNFATYAARPVARIGSSGLFALRQQTLRLRQERETLKAQTADAVRAIDVAAAKFTASAQLRTAALALKLEQNLSAGRRQVLVLGAACATLFLWLSWLIGRGIRGHVTIIQTARAGAEADRKLAQDRLVQQQKAEADLRAAQTQLLDASRQAGMAEVATGVLHNVGNVLNSVNVSVHLIKDKVQASSVAKLARTADMIDAHAADIDTFLTADAKGRLIPGYVSKLARLLGGESAAVMDEVENLSRGIEHIKQVVQFQQNYATASTVCELVNPADLIEDALRLNLIALDRHGVTIIRDVAGVGTVRIDKHKTLQILVNLISNAKNAMKELNDNKERSLTLRASAVEIEAGLRLRLEVADNGSGIAPENLSRIFAHGFTTRAEGHGFGLHSAANAAREMNGTLTVSSAGPGQGATFVLEIPVVTSEVRV